MNVLVDDGRAVNPYEEGTFIKRHCHWYLNKVFREGDRRQLNGKDIFKIAKKDSSTYLCNQLVKLFEQYGEKSKLEKKKVNFPKIFFHFIFRKWMQAVFLYGLVELARISNTIFLKKVLDAISHDGKDEKLDSYYWVFLLSLSLFIFWLLLHPVDFFMEILGTTSKSAVMNLIYQKVLRVRLSKLGEISSGHVLTLFGSDAQKIQQLLKNTPYLVVAPIEVIIMVALLWNEVGPSSLAGIAVIFVFLTIQGRLARLFAKVRAKSLKLTLMTNTLSLSYSSVKVLIPLLLSILSSRSAKALKLTGKRLNIMNEIISSMLVTKMFTWEDPFSKQVSKARQEESTQILKSTLIKALNQGLFGCTPFVSAFATFVTYYFTDGEVTVGKVYFAMSIFFIIRVTVIVFMPIAIQSIAELNIICKRIQRFLEEDEMDRIGYKALLKEQKAYVEFDKVNVTWEGEIPKPILHDISFKADQDNNLIIIHGPVGAGKTTLLMVIMNEVAVCSGSVKIEGKIAYTAQQPWIFSGTIKQNILFGQEYNEIYFNMVLESCALLADLDLFEKREYTLVGEKGVSLSGGQKARISFARAVYSNADIYLLDDPLSAVDTRVGKYIFERCIKDLLKEKVVFLVTHQTQYLCEATHTIHLTTDSMLPFDTETDLTENSNENVEYRENNVPNDEISLAEKDTSKDITEKINENSIPEEHRKRGKVSYNVYTSYFRKGIGTISIIALCILLIFSQAFLTFTDYWIGEWAKYEEDRRSKNSTDTQFVFNDNQDNNIYLFATLAVVSFILTVLSIGLFNSALIKCSWELHDRMFHRVLKAPMFFFDTNSIGQILNRFSGDIHVLDEELPEPFSEFVLIALLCMAGLILSCTSVPYLAVAAIIVTIVFIFFRNFYMCTARQIKRIEATDRSPTFTHLSATLSGISSIRSLSMEREIHREFVRCLDYQAESRIMFYRCSRWFSQRLDGGFIIFVIICMFASVAVAVHTETDVGLIGVTFTYLISLCGMFQYGVRQSTEVDNLMTSAERVGEYTKLEIEEESSELVEVDKEWVKDGSINFDNVCYAYHKSLPYVLHDLSFRINPTEKIGIVGRTGAGKSSLISLIFRLGVSEGSIEIDGYDISRLTLKTLRQAISVIPQDPVLFCGSLRTNMDPFKEYADEEIWDALEKVEMKVSVEKFNRGLETEIAESGGNLSVGEKQLICLARALLKQNKILLIDEATANIDYRTDTLIQTTIRTSFKDCTVLTIAHRLNTIMDSDRIMVIHQGRIVEFDQPSVLLQLENGYLRKMVDETGRKCVELLDNLAHGRR